MKARSSAAFVRVERPTMLPPTTEDAPPSPAARRYEGPRRRRINVPGLTNAGCRGESRGCLCPSAAEYSCHIHDLEILVTRHSRKRQPAETSRGRKFGLFTVDNAYYEVKPNSLAWPVIAGDLDDLEQLPEPTGDTEQATMISNWPWRQPYGIPPPGGFTQFLGYACIIRVDLLFRPPEHVPSPHPTTLPDA